MPTSDRILATYWIETPGPLEQAAQALAGEQSTGTFVRVPGETEELRRRFSARVERLTPLEEYRAWCCTSFGQSKSVCARACSTTSRSTNCRTS